MDAGKPMQEGSQASLLCRVGSEYGEPPQRLKQENTRSHMEHRG